MNLQYGVTRGYGDILWRSVGAELSQGFLPYSAVQEDEVHWVYIPHWHNLSVGDLCWLLYQPALSYLNGWQDHADELDLSSIVNCEILEFYHPISRLEKAKETEHEARDFYDKWQKELDNQGIDSKVSFTLPTASEIAGWAMVRCQRVVALSDIPSHFQQREIPSTLLHSLSNSSDSLVFETERLKGVGIRVGQEAYEEWILTKKDNPRVVYYSFSLDNGLFEICNAPLP